MSLNLARLNARQREAVLHPDGPLLVLAGAGSGKTSTMTYRIAHLIAVRKLPPSKILGLSFTNKAATELKSRVNGLVRQNLGPKSTQGLIVSTFHSLCVRLLRAHATELGFQSNFTIVDENDRRDILKEVFKNININDRKFDLDVVLFQIGQAKNKLMRPEEAEQYFLQAKGISSEYQIATASSFAHYQRRLRLLNAMDFDDLLYYAVELLRRHSEVRKKYNERFEHILVDEYQDTNPTQFEILQLLTESRQNICVVGDDDQSIYSWRGADPTHILEFKSHYPAARVITLDQNYRSTNSILEAANSVIMNNSKRHPKTLWSERGPGVKLLEIITEDDHGEGQYVSDQIQAIAKEENRNWKDFAILYRSNAQSRIFEEALRRAKIPYKIVGGMSFLERKEVKDALSYLRVIVNSSDDASLRRIINWPARGIGKGGVEALGARAFDLKKPLYDVLCEAPEIAPRADKGCRELVALVQGLRSELEAVKTPAELGAWGKRALDRIQIKKGLEEDVEDAVQLAKRIENVEEIIHSLGQSPEEETRLGGLHALQEYLSRMTLQALQDEKDEKDKSKKEDEQNQVTLLTLHGSKGLEYPVVFLVGIEDGFLPHKRTLEEATDLGEERRLCYVGITRARDKLYFTRARSRIRFGKPVPRNRSRFLDEVPAHLLVAEDHSHGPTKDDPAEARKAHEERVKNHLAEIRAMLLKS